MYRCRNARARATVTPQEKTFSGLATRTVAHLPAHVFNPGTLAPQTIAVSALHNTLHTGEDYTRTSISYKSSVILSISQGTENRLRSQSTRFKII
ncbi:MAG: hypothetical protein PWQ69_1515 [Methanomicrobiaceae archaeon]|nr:hypothetical protein [Methanomicrobiaceae archaeon]